MLLHEQWSRSLFVVFIFNDLVDALRSQVEMVGDLSKGRAIFTQQADFPVSDGIGWVTFFAPFRDVLRSNFP